MVNTPRYSSKMLLLNTLHCSYELLIKVVPSLVMFDVTTNKMPEPITLQLRVCFVTFTKTGMYAALHPSFICCDLYFGSMFMSFSGVILIPQLPLSQTGGLIL